MADPIRNIQSVRHHPGAAAPAAADMQTLFVPHGSGLVAEMKRVGIRPTPEILAVISGYAARSGRGFDGRPVAGGFEIDVPSKQLLANGARWQRYVETFAANGNDRAGGFLPGVRMPIAPREIDGNRVALERPVDDKVTQPDQRWMWDRNKVDAAYKRELANAGLPEALFLVPAEGIPDEQLKRLETKRPGREALAAYDAQRGSTVKALRSEGKRTGNATYDKLAAHLEKQSSPRDLWQMKQLLDILHRIGDGARLDRVKKPTLRVVDHHQDTPITEAYFSLNHDGVAMRGTAADGTPFEPSGYRVKWCTTAPDASGACTPVKTEDWPLGQPFARDGRYYLHFAEQNSVLQAGQQYWVHATAYNAIAESAPSSSITGPFPAAQRGDLNKNGTFDNGDVNLMMAQLLDSTHPRVLADVDKDGAVTQHDLDRLLELVAAQQP